MKLLRKDNIKILSQVGNGFVVDNYIITFENDNYFGYMINIYPFYAPVISEEDNFGVKATGNVYTFYHKKNVNFSDFWDYPGIFSENSTTMEKKLKKLFLLRFFEPELYIKVITEIDFRCDDSLFRHYNDKDVVYEEIYENLFMYYFRKIDYYYDLSDNLTITHTTHTPVPIVEGFTSLILQGISKGTRGFYVYAFLKHNNNDIFLNPPYEFTFNKNVLGFLPYLSHGCGIINRTYGTFSAYRDCFKQMSSNDFYELRFNFAIPEKYIIGHKLTQKITIYKFISGKILYKKKKNNGFFYVEFYAPTGNMYFDFFIPVGNLGHIKIKDHSINMRSATMKQMSLMVKKLKFQKFLIKTKEVRKTIATSNFFDNFEFFYDRLEYPSDVSLNFLKNVKNFSKTGNGYVIDNIIIKINHGDYVIYKMILFPYYRTILPKNFESPEGVIYKEGYFHSFQDTYFYHIDNIDSDDFFRRLNLDGILNINTSSMEEKLRTIFLLRSFNSKSCRELINSNFREKVFFIEPEIENVTYHKVGDFYFYYYEKMKNKFPNKVFGENYISSESRYSVGLIKTKRKLTDVYRFLPFVIKNDCVIFYSTIEKDTEFIFMPKNCCGEQKYDIL